MAATIPATISHKFELSEINKPDMGKRNLLSPKIDVVHKNVKLGFLFELSLNESGIRGIWIIYDDGPKDTIQMERQLFVIGGHKRIPIARDPAIREYRKGKGWGNSKVLPASVDSLQMDGYLSADGKTLEFLAELSIKETAFPQQIFASLSHKFSVHDFVNIPGEDSDDDEDHPMDVPLLVAHNNAKFSFKLSALRHLHRNMFYLEYVEGPLNRIVLDVELFVIKGRKRKTFLFEQNWTLRKHSRILATRLRFPRAVGALSRAGLLSLDKKSVHIIAELSIPENMFQVQPSVEGPPTSVLVDSLGFYLFQEVTTPTATDSNTSSRVEFISNEEEKDHKTHLWAHKEVLSFASDVFKDLFDPNKPEETKMESLKKGEMTIDLGGDALKQMMHFIYVRQPDQDFDSFALEILTVADRFLVKGLKEECERSLVDQLDRMDIEDLIYCVKVSHTFNLKNLTAACVEILPFYMQRNNDIGHPAVETLIELAEEHNYGSIKSACELNLVHKLDTADDRPSFLSLLSIARQHDLHVLINHCVQWYKNNFTQLKAVGFIDGLVNDFSETGRSVILFLMESMAVMP